MSILPVKETIDISASSTLGFGGHNAVVVFRKVTD